MKNKDRVTSNFTENKEDYVFGLEYSKRHLIYPTSNECRHFNTSKIKVEEGHIYLKCTQCGYEFLSEIDGDEQIEDNNWDEILREFNEFKGAIHGFNSIEIDWLKENYLSPEKK